MEQFLRTAAIFQSLSQTDMMPIANASKKVSHPANAPLFAERDPATHFYLVISGSVRLYRLTPDGKEKVIEIIRAGKLLPSRSHYWINPTLYLPTPSTPRK